MAQTSEGGKKAAQTQLSKDPEYFKKLAQRNKGVKRTKPTGFQLLDKDAHKVISAKGGTNGKQAIRDGVGRPTADTGDVHQADA